MFDFYFLCLIHIFQVSDIPLTSCCTLNFVHCTFTEQNLEVNVINISVTSHLFISVENKVKELVHKHKNIKNIT